MKDCGIVKDLLPLVAEQMASEESTALVMEHIETCADCRAALEAMKAPVEAEPAVPLKTVRKAVKRRGLLIAGLIACLVAALVIGVFARLMKPIPLASSEIAFADATVIPETLPLPASQAKTTSGSELPMTEVPDAADGASMPQTQPDTDETLVKDALKQIVVILNEDSADMTISYILVPQTALVPDKTDPESSASPYASIAITLAMPEDGETDAATHGTDAASNRETVAYVYSVPQPDEANGQTIEPEAVIASTPKTLKLTPKWDTTLLIERTGGEISVAAYTTLWDMRHPHAETPQEIDLSGVDAVFFEPYNNTDREALYLRDGYTPEAGFALPRLVMNTYFLIAAIGTAILAIVWFVLRLCKRRKASSVLGVLLLIAGSFVLAFLAAGFPATTIAPMRELTFVLVITVLLIGAGLCGRKLLRKE
jgi:hypothetical protein